MEAKELEKAVKAGRIHHMIDIRWTQGGCTGGGAHS